MNRPDLKLAHAIDPNADVLKWRRTHHSYASDETLVPDRRDGVSPCQMVEKKLMSLLKNAYCPVSQLRTRGLSNGQNRR
jgi:hypothetical protein